MGRKAYNQLKTPDPKKLQFKRPPHPRFKPLDMATFVQLQHFQPASIGYALPSDLPRYVSGHHVKGPKSPSTRPR